MISSLSSWLAASKLRQSLLTLEDLYLSVPYLQEILQTRLIFPLPHTHSPSQSRQRRAFRCRWTRLARGASEAAFPKSFCYAWKVSPASQMLWFWELCLLNPERRYRRSGGISPSCFEPLSYLSQTTGKWKEKLSFSYTFSSGLEILEIKD